MSSIIVSGDTSGAITLAAPAVAGTTTINLPATSGTMTVTASGLTSGRVTYAGAGGLLQDSSNLTFNGTTLTSAGFSGPLNGTVGATTPSTGAFTTLTTSSTVTLNGGTANGVAYLDGSKVLTSGSALIWTGATQKLGFQNAAANGYGYIYNAGAGTNTDLGFEVGGTEQMRLTSTGLGIGTSSPSSKLQVANGALTISDATTHAFLKISPNSGSAAFLDIPTVGSSLLIRTSASSTTDTNAVAVTSSGSVGIGTSSPGQKLHVNTSSGSSYIQLSTGSNANLIGYLGANSGASTVELVSNSTYPLVFATNGTERARIDSSGNVGIGMTPSSGWRSVDRVLQIQSSGVIRGQTNANLIDLGSNYYINNSNLSVYIASDYASRFTQYQGVFSWESAASGTAGNTITWTERARIDSSGNLRVGTTSGNADARTTIAQGSTDSSPCIDYQKGSATTTTAQVYARFFCNGGSTATGSITANGVSAATFTAYSDRRLKENIVDLPSQLNNIMSLRPVEFDYKGYPSGDGHQIGFIAQEVQSVYPDLVAEGDNGMLTLSDMNKNDARLIKAIQELKAIVDAQAARIAALEAQ